MRWGLYWFLLYGLSLHLFGPGAVGPLLLGWFAGLLVGSFDMDLWDWMAGRLGERR